MEKNNQNFEKLFRTPKPIIGMIHLKGLLDTEIIGRAINEVDTLIANGVDAVMVENYFGNEDNVEEVLRYLRSYRKNIIYGVNVLGDYFKSYELADTYGASFIQIDSVAGHLAGYDDLVFGKNIKSLRSTSDTFLLGGVRFKYQPYLSKRTLEEDLKIGMDRCDAIVVTGAGTGKDTELSKLKEFRSIIGTFPLVVGAGLTSLNCAEKLSVADAGIVGSYLKDNYHDNGEVSPIHTREFMDQVKTIRMNK